MSCLKVLVVLFGVLTGTAQAADFETVNIGSCEVKEGDRMTYVCPGGYKTVIKPMEADLGEGEGVC